MRRGLFSEHNILSDISKAATDLLFQPAYKQGTESRNKNNELNYNNLEYLQNLILLLSARHEKPRLGRGLVWR
ncbi:hypothetical protein D3C77_64270 [compost metagenome]